MDFLFLHQRCLDIRTGCIQLLQGLCRFTGCMAGLFFFFFHTFYAETQFLLLHIGLLAELLLLPLLPQAVKAATMSTAMSSARMDLSFFFIIFPPCVL